jgi:hypothetical protein
MEIFPSNFNHAFIVDLTTSGPGLATVGTTTDFWRIYEKLQNLQTP